MRKEKVYYVGKVETMFMCLCGCRFKGGVSLIMTACHLLGYRSVSDLDCA